MTTKKNGGAALLDHIMRLHGLKSDADVSRLIDISAPSISKIRSEKAPITPAHIIKIMDGAKMSLKKIRDILAGEAEK